MGTLQSRLDADFLLAHMCSVKFKEWIVVLATLLRRSEVCLTFVCTGQQDLKLCTHELIKTLFANVSKGDIFPQCHVDLFQF